MHSMLTRGESFGASPLPQRNSTDSYTTDEGWIPGDQGRLGRLYYEPQQMSAGQRQLGNDRGYSFSNYPQTPPPSSNTSMRRFSAASIASEAFTSTPPPSSNTSVRGVSYISAAPDAFTMASRLGSSATVRRDSYTPKASDVDAATAAEGSQRRRLPQQSDTFSVRSSSSPQSSEELCPVTMYAQAFSFPLP